MTGHICLGIMKIACHAEVKRNHPAKRNILMNPGKRDIADEILYLTSITGCD